MNSKITQTSHPVSGVEVPINPSKSRKRFMSAGKPARKSVTSAQIFSFSANKSLQQFLEKKMQFLESGGKGDIRYLIRCQAEQRPG